MQQGDGRAGIGDILDADEAQAEVAEFVSAMQTSKAV